MKASLNASCGKEMVPKSEKGKVNGSREVSYVQEQKKRPTGAAFCVGGDKGSRTPDLLNAIGKSGTHEIRRKCGMSLLRAYF